jgi:hypothetical protein
VKKNIQYLLAMAAATVMIGLFSPQVTAQNFDPAQFRERALTRYREQLDVKSDEDWKKIEPLVGKVMDARTAMGGFGFGGRGGGRGGRGGGGGGGGGGDAANSDQGNNNNNRNRFGAPSAEEQALEKALEAKAPAEEVKTKLAAVRESRKAKEAALDKAQDELRKSLSPRQEASAVLARLLK